MECVNKFEVKNSIAVVIQHEEFSDERVVLIEKSRNGKIEIPFTMTFDNRHKNLCFNEEYLILADREFHLNKEDFIVVALDTGEQIDENKESIYEEVSKVNKYGTFGVKSFFRK